MRLPLYALTAFFIATTPLCSDSSEPFKARSFEHLVNTTRGIHPDLITMHIQLYQGYVKNAQLLKEELKKLSDSGQGRTPQYAELKRRYGWEFDGMRMHELYFGNLGGDGVIDHNSAFSQRVSDRFGSFDAWKKDFIDTGMMRGIGWVATVWDPEERAVTTIWVNEHDVGHLVNTTPLLIMDVFEHAYISQFGLKRNDYIDAFFNNIDWNIVNQRLKNIQNGMPK